MNAAITNAKTDPSSIDNYPSRGEKIKILDRKDPVIYSPPPSSETPAEMSPEEYRQFEQNGYLFYKGFFQGDELKEIQQEFDRLKNNADSFPEKEAIFELEGNALRSLFNVHRRDHYFSKLWKRPKLYDKASQILGSDAYIHQSRINLKPAFKGKEFYWHSDFETWHTEDGMPRMRAVSCLISLTENNAFNGSLMVMPGSHKKFISCIGKTPKNHHLKSLKKQEYGVPDEETLTQFAQTYGIESPLGPPGSVLFFDCNLIHGSGSNISHYPRSNIFFVYNSVENKLQAPFCGSDPRPEFIASREPA